jgi:hypothetical protein
VRALSIVFLIVNDSIVAGKGVRPGEGGERRGGMRGLGKDEGGKVEVVGGGGVGGGEGGGEGEHQLTIHNEQI